MKKQENLAMFLKICYYNSANEKRKTEYTRAILVEIYRKKVLEEKRIELEKQKSIAIINKSINEMEGDKND